jgi:hypothetical protein
MGITLRDIVWVIGYKRYLVYATPLPSLRYLANNLSTIEYGWSIFIWNQWA